jgi:hypothetical protein
VEKKYKPIIVKVCDKNDVLNIFAGVQTVGHSRSREHRKRAGSKYEKSEWTEHEEDRSRENKSN